MTGAVFRYASAPLSNQLKTLLTNHFFIAHEAGFML
jgi:hypothetical protein